MTNYYRIAIDRKILHNTTAMNTMSFVLFLHRVGSIASAQIHPLPSLSMHKLDQYLVEFHDQNLGWHV